jgi:hypothetical protein
MSSLFSPWTLAIGCALAAVGLQASPNAELWGVCLLTLPVAVWLLGGKQAYRVLLWVLFVNWLQIVGAVVTADLTGSVISEGFRGTYSVKAIIYSLCAISVLALGMRSGTQLGQWLFRFSVRRTGGSLAGDEYGVRLNRLMLCYFVSLAVAQALGAVAAHVPGLAQPVLALGLIRFVCLYLIAAVVFESGGGYGWLILVAVLEMITGLVGFFANYKEAPIVMLIAFASSRRPVSARMWIFSMAAVVAVAWASLFWTSVKTEYRHLIVGNPIEQRLAWMQQRFSGGSVDYGKAVVALFQRIGYTELYAAVIARADAGSLPRKSGGYYVSAVQHVLTPRILFPDKQALNDSKLTTALLGLRIQSDTSIGIGYVAQAHVDFGFPGLLLPMLVIGVMLGVSAKYFMTRSAPLIVREAFTTAALFLGFPYEENIDKALGGFITGFLVMAVMLKFAYPKIARWLALGSVPNRRLVSESSFTPAHGSVDSRLS